VDLPSISVVICTLGRPDLVSSALGALDACTPGPLEVLVVDGDAQRSAQPVVEPPGGATRARYVSCAPGLTHQRNVALAEVRGDVVLFLDDDARPEPDVILGLQRAYDDPTVVGVTGTVLEPQSHRLGHQTSRLRRLLFRSGDEGTFTSYGYPRRLTDLDTPRDVEFMPGCFMSARTPSAREVGFDEHLKGYALAEDEDFSYRLSRLGRIRFVPTLVVHHDNAGFAGSATREFTRRVVLNRSYLFHKNFRPRLSSRLRFAGMVGLLGMHRLMNGNVRGALGVIDGVRDLRKGRSSARSGTGPGRRASGRAPRRTVLAYHAVGECARADDRNSLFVSPEAFADQMADLARSRRVVPLSEALDDGLPPGKPVVAITFDDGYRSVREHALPVLERHGFPATMFVPTAHIGDENRWDEPCPPCSLEIMDDAELRDCEARGLSIEPHGHAHVDLTEADEVTASVDIAASLEHLRTLLGREPRFLAFPFSHGSPDAQRAAARLGLVAAFSIDRPGTGPFDRARVQVTRYDTLRAFRCKSSGRYLAVRFSAAARAAVALTRPIRATVRRVRS